MYLKMSFLKMADIFQIILKCIFMNGNGWISIKMSPQFVPEGPLDN